MNQLGDLLFSLPVLSAARKEWPEKTIYCFARPDHIPLLAVCGFADRAIPKRKTGLPGTVRMALELRGEKIDKGIFFSESPESLLTGFSCGIKERVGFSGASLSFLLTKTVERSGVPSLANNKNLGLAAGLKDIPDDYLGLVKVPAESSLETAAWLKENGIDAAKLVVIAPGASRRRTEKYWDENKWKELMASLIAAGLSPVVTGSPREKAALAGLADGLGGKVKVFTASSGILSLAALFQKAKLFVGIDSGAMHLAASLGTKVVALFGPTDPGQVGPMPLKNNVVINNKFMSAISTEEVWQKVSELTA